MEEVDIANEINFGDDEPVEDPVQQEQEESVTETEPVEEPEPEQAPAPEPSEPTAEEKAAALGHVPKDEWRGDPNKWVTAEEFLERSEKVVPLLKKDREKLFKTVADLERKIEETNTNWKKYHEQDRKRAEERFKKELDSIKKRQKEAVAEGDTEAFEEAEKEREALEEQRVKAETVVEKKDQSRTSEEVIEWGKENPWFGRDMKKTHYMQQVWGVVKYENPHIKEDSVEALQETLKEAKKLYPEMFGAKPNPRRKAAPTVAEGNARGMSGATKSFADLPAEAQHQCRVMQKQGMTEKEYVAEYFGLEKGGVDFGEY